MNDGDRSLAIFIDFENLALGFQGRRDRFDIERVLERLVEKGKIVAKKAYADWSRFASYTAPLHEAAIELIEIPAPCPDRQELRRHPPVRRCDGPGLLQGAHRHLRHRLRRQRFLAAGLQAQGELGKHVIGLGMQESTSDLLRDNCDEFIYYEDLGKAPTLPPTIDPQLPETKRKAFALLLESLLALRRENKEVLWSSMVKDTMKRKKPSFNEAYHGYRTFSELLEDAQKEGLLELDTDKRSRTYVVTRFGDEMRVQPAEAAQPAKKKSRRRRSSTKKSTPVSEITEPKNGPLPPTETSPTEPSSPSKPSAAPSAPVESTIDDADIRF